MKSLPTALRALMVALATGGAHADPPPTLQEEWKAYKARFLSQEGRLVDDAAESVSHSEGQGYAMLLAALLDDQPTFDRLWLWTAVNLQTRPDGLFSWRWRPGDQPHVKDPNDAADGDLLIAWALAEAGRRWEPIAYDPSARKIAHAIVAKLVFPSSFGPLLAPAVAGFRDRPDGPVVNLSYWVFPAFDALKRVAPDVDWAGLRKSGLALLDASKFGPRKLPSDWIGLQERPHPAAGFPARFGYDILRAPLYLAWGAPTAPIGALVEAWAGGGDGDPSVIDIATGAPVEPLREPGYRAVAALARCVAKGVPFPENLRTVDLSRYYPATLQMLALVALERSHAAC